ncbi:DUF1289 domain-containing protein [Candidatus Spongiihabitans sp.]|uniref:DUF1289 domain-containing protein n=1 Tax=Candidatus Spongiihabitans sp. TaxID=3101308 RepID=UPI003C6F410B
MTQLVPRRKSNRRRGAHQPPKLDTTVPSPCLSVCRFDGEPFCRGCYRNADEIRDWIIMSGEQKRAVLALIAARREQETGEQIW